LLIFTRAMLASVGISIAWVKINNS